MTVRKVVRPSKEGMTYLVVVSNKPVWTRHVKFDKPHRASGTAFRQAAKDQESAFTFIMDKIKGE